MRVGIACPYSLDVPGGVQAHILDLAEALLGLGHEVSVIGPVEEAPAKVSGDFPPYVVIAGRALAVPYNGSVARLAFGPVSLRRVRRWLRDGDFDVLHVHEPVAPSLSLLATLVAQGPIVATFHAAAERSRALAAAQGVLQPIMEKITGRIAVSPLARRLQVEHMAGDAVEIPNGVAVARFSEASPLPALAEGETIGFLGRFEEPRKGFSVLLDACERLAGSRPALRLVVAGPGSPDSVVLPEALRDRVVFLGRVSEEEKAGFLRGVRAYVAPNLGGESFGIVLTEAMAAGAPIVASDLDAFRRVLDDGKAGLLFPVGDAAALASALQTMLDAPDQGRRWTDRAHEVVKTFDWPVVAEQVVEVYSSAIAAFPAPVTADDSRADHLLKRVTKYFLE